MESETCALEEARDIAEALVPVMDSTYQRTTLHLPNDNARATFDKALTWELFNSDGVRTDRRVLIDKRMVVETKNPSTASPTDRLLWDAAIGRLVCPSTPPEWRCSTRACPLTGGTEPSTATWAVTSTTPQRAEAFKAPVQPLPGPTWKLE